MYGGAMTVRLAFRPPLDWSGLLGFLAPRATPGVEAIAAGVYRRTIGLGDAAGTIEVRAAAGEPHLVMRVRRRRLPEVVERARRLFDLAAGPVRIADHLAGSPELAPLVARRPGLRVPGAWDAFELAVRAVLGQQVTVRGATTLAGRLVRAFGRPLDRAEDGLTHLFPRPETLADADLASIGLPRARAATIRGLARGVARGEIALDASRGLEDAVARLAAVPGIGAWTAHYIAMRAFGEPDAFPAADLGLRRALGNGAGPLAPARLAGRGRTPPGETVSYQTLARRIGAPAAVRAVGAANRTNPIGIVVPCHRVIGADGSLTGYAGGIERKRWLLTHERAGTLEQRSLV